MTALNGTKKSRLKVTTYTNIFLGCVTMVAMYAGMETVATVAISGILTISTMFIGGDTYRKSDKV